jgi:hypothetical protein
MKRTIFIKEEYKDRELWLRDAPEFKTAWNVEVEHRRAIANDLQMPEPLENLYTRYLVPDSFPHDIVFARTSRERNYLGVRVLGQLKEIKELNPEIVFRGLRTLWMFQHALEFYIIYHDTDGTEAKQLMESWERATDNLDALVKGYAQEKINSLEAQGFFKKDISYENREDHFKHSPDKAGLILILDKDNKPLDQLAHPVGIDYAYSCVPIPNINESHYQDTLLSCIPSYKPDEKASKFLYLPSKLVLITEADKIVLISKRRCSGRKKIK